MKKFSKFIISLFTCVLVVLGLASCGPKNEKTAEEFETAKSQVIYSNLTEKPGLLTGFPLTTEIEDFQVSYTTTAKENADGKKILDVVVNEEDGSAETVVNAPSADDNFPVADLKVKLIAEFHRTENEQKVVYGTKEFNVLIGLRAGLMDWDEYMEVGSEGAVTVQGVVTFYTHSASYGNMDVFLQDEVKGGYYLYRVDDKHLSKFVIGNEVRVEGFKTIYSGLHEVKSVSRVDVVSTGNTVTAVDATDAIKNAKDNKAANVSTEYVGKLVEVSDFVLTAKPEVGSGSYNVAGKVGETAITLRVSGDLGDAKAAIDEELKGYDAGDILKVTAAGNWYSAFQLSAISADKIEKTGSADVNEPQLPTTVTELKDVAAAALALDSGETTEMYRVAGTLVAKDSSGRAYVRDAAGYTILVYNKALADTPIGAAVELAGTCSLYNGLPQFGSETLTVISAGETGATVDHGTPVSVTGAEFTKSVLTDKDGALLGKYIEITGVKVVAGSYVNVGYDSTVIQANVNKTSAAAAAAILTAENDGKEVIIRGYSYGCNSTQARLVIVEVELVG